MSVDSLAAYDVPERVKSYDADMDVMHPLRHEMIEVVLETLPFAADSELRVMDLGAGTGIFSARVLERFANASVLAVDGAAAMVDLATGRMGPLADRMEWVTADFRKLPAETVEPGSYDLFISSYALHHLNADEKSALLRTIFSALKPGGWLFNADIVVAESEVMEQRFQQLRIEGVTSRAAEGDKRFSNAETTRTYLTEMEIAENDQPQTAAMDLAIIREAGFASAEILWKKFREVVIGGSK